MSIRHDISALFETWKFKKRVYIDLKIIEVPHLSFIILKFKLDSSYFPDGAICHDYRIDMSNKHRSREVLVECYYLFNDVHNKFNKLIEIESKEAMTPKCDLCGKTTITSDLNSVYHTKGVECICAECEIKLDKHLDKLDRITRQIKINFFKKFLANFKKKKEKG